MLSDDVISSIIITSLTKKILVMFFDLQFVNFCFAYTILYYLQIFISIIIQDENFKKIPTSNLLLFFSFRLHPVPYDDEMQLELTWLGPLHVIYKHGFLPLLIVLFTQSIFIVVFV